MQPVTPYRFSEQLGQCRVGSVWSAVDELGRPLTVAVLDTAAGAQGWREAFARVVNSLVEPGPERPRHVRADATADVPWAAYAGAAGVGVGAERVFELLGQQVVATPASPVVPAPRHAVDDVPGPSPQPTWTASSSAQPSSGAGTAYPTSSPPDPTSGRPMPAQPMSGQPMPAQPMSGQPMPAQPISPVGEPSPMDSYGLSYTSPAAPDLFSASAASRRIEPSPPRKRSLGKWAWIAAIVVCFLAGGGVVFALTGGGNDPDPSPTTTASAPQAVGELPTGAPASPGIEPPKAGAWPAKWPRYNSTDSVSTLNLDGLGFPIKVPPAWQCTLAARAEGYLKYHCGTPPSEAAQFGGEIVVRACAQPCDATKQTQMREVEEAWGAQWIRSGPFSTYAEQIVQVDGEERHGLVVVGYWRGGADGEIDHQLVFRMTAPVKDAQQLRRVATYIRDTLIF